MKSQVHYLLESWEKQNKELNKQDICDIAYAFQEAVIEVLAKKTIRAAIQYSAKTIAIV
jgi:tRNA A37 threonylcarbamoyltransferase TsaD